MRNSILAAICFAFAALGFTGGIITKNIQNQAEINEAWNDITVVADGTLIANPAAYAYDPQSLADAQNVRIINNRTAAIDAANQAVVDTTPTLNR